MTEVTEIFPGDNVRIGHGGALYHVWIRLDDRASIATPDGTSVLGNVPVDRLVFVERTDCFCHPGVQR